jgi:hypothetical protein
MQDRTSSHLMEVIFNVAPVVRRYIFFVQFQSMSMEDDLAEDGASKHLGHMQVVVCIGELQNTSRIQQLV